MIEIVWRQGETETDLENGPVGSVLGEGGDSSNHIRDLSGGHSVDELPGLISDCRAHNL